jgi:two-component system nitrate/nitrite response regulator NarL
VDYRKTLSSVEKLRIGLDMEIIILTPIRLFGDGLMACFSRFPEMSVHGVLSSLASLNHALTTTAVDLVLVDVTQGIDFFDMRIIAVERPDVSLVALGLTEQEKEVIRCGRAGFTGYVAREATVEELYQTLFDVVGGRLACSAEMSGHLLRALFHRDTLSSEQPEMERALTRREAEILQLLGQGLANKEIARELSLSVSTVKHHVHNVLDKLQLQRRTQAIQRVRDVPRVIFPPHTKRPGMAG